MTRSVSACLPVGKLGGFPCAKDVTFNAATSACKGGGWPLAACLQKYFRAAAWQLALQCEVGPLIPLSLFTIALTLSWLLT